MGFSALRFGAAVLPQGQVHSVEMDPTVARLAQQVVQHAGLQQVVTVHVGHSEESLWGMGYGWAEWRACGQFVSRMNLPEFGHVWKIWALIACGGCYGMLLDTVLSGGSPATAERSLRRDFFRPAWLQISERFAALVPKAWSVGRGGSAGG